MTPSHFIDQRLFAGTYAGARLLVDIGGTVTTDITAGRLGTELATALPANALFSLESISKVVATVPVALALSERGVLNLDQPVAHQFTLRHLLSHASGLPDTDDPGVDLDANDTPEKLWRRIFAIRPTGAPGTRVRYSDLGYLIAGHVICTAAGKSLDQLARELLWEPLGMRDTQYNPPETLLPRLTSNRGLHGKCVDAIDRTLGGVVGCDGVFSTAADLRRFGRMLLGAGSLDGQRVLNPESVVEMVRDQTPFATADAAIADDFTYLYEARKGLGWELPGTPFAHGGSQFSARAFGKVGGTGTFFWIDPARDLTAIYLTNHGQPVPFARDGWNQMIAAVGPKVLFSMI